MVHVHLVFCERARRTVCRAHEVIIRGVGETFRGIFEHKQRMVSTFLCVEVKDLRDGERTIQRRYSEGCTSSRLRLHGR